MATDTYWQLEKEYYTISPNHDLIIRAIEYVEITRTEGDGANAHEVKSSVPNKVHEFKVQRDVLVKSSTYFHELLGANGGFKEGDDLHEDPAGSVELWLKILHGCDLQSTYETTTIKGVWEMLATAHKYGLDPKMAAAKTWFESWYKTHRAKAYFEFHEYRELLFPCHTFDYPAGFKEASKYLSYNAAGHITEKRPDGFYHEHLRLDQNIMQQNNAARGRLKTILHRGLYAPIEKLLTRSACSCKEKTLYAYERALSNTGAWPLESAFLRFSVNEILEKLEDFRQKAKVPTMCYDCVIDFSYVTIKASSDTRDYFDGLCLDCMDASKPKYGDANEDYWHHAKRNVAWDLRCRILHGQPTWYFSFLGRRQNMLEWVQKKRSGGYDRDDSD